MNGWAKIKSGAEYAGVSKRTFQKWLKDGLRHSRKDGTVYIKYSWIDDFLVQFEIIENVDQIVNEVLEGFK